MKFFAFLFSANFLLFLSASREVILIFNGVVFVCIFLLHFIQVHLLQNICRLLHLPFIFRVVRSTGLDEDDTEVYEYDPSPYNKYRFDVEVNIDGMIRKFIKRG
jgi:hypothetical protein